MAASVPRILARSGTRSVESSTTRKGDAPGTMRTVSWGSSWSTVPTPTSTASHAARNACDARRSASPLIHRASPVAVAIRPSSVWANFRMTNGLSGGTARGPISSLMSTAGATSSDSVAHGFARGSDVPETTFLRPQIAEVAAVGSGRQRLDGHHVDAGSPQALHLLRVVRQQAHGSHAEGLQYRRRVGVLAGIDGQSERQVGFERVCPTVLLRVRPQLVHEADPPALVAGRVDEDAPPGGTDGPQPELQLDTAVAAQRPQCVTGQAFGVDPRHDVVARRRAHPSRVPGTPTPTRTRRRTPRKRPPRWAEAR